MRPTPAGRGGTARCCSPYNAILERLDTMDVRIQQAVDDANAAMSAAVIQAGNAAQSASDALTQAGIAAGKASDAAADAADAAQDAADAAQALSDINDTISTVLNSTLGGKVDKLTTAGLHLYSHTGSTQGEEEPIDGTTSNTIPIRDGNGRMQAADPASGATDKTLVTANWISQTGNSAPNNVVHRSGNETIAGVKTFTDLMKGTTIGYRVSGNLAEDKWYEVAKTSLSGRRYFEVKVTTCSGTFDQFLQIEALGGYPTLICRRLGTLTGYASSNIAFGTDGDGKRCLLIKGYDPRWVTRVDIFQEFRNGSDGDFEAGAMTAMDDLTGYINVIYGSDMS